MEFAAQVLAAVRAVPRTIDVTDRAAVLDNLVFVHQLIVASERIIDACIVAVLQAPRRRTTFDDLLLKFMHDHALDERNHAEWLACDLSSADVDVTTRPLFADAVEAAGAQYYLAHHAHPGAVLGYMATLECFPMPVEEVDRWEQLHGAALTRTLRYHAEHDPAHGADVCLLLDCAPHALQPLILNNAIRTAQHFAFAAARFGKGSNG